MSTINQILRKPRKKIFTNKNIKGIGLNPQKRGTCVRVKTMTPRKPNSAIRKIARVKLTNGNIVTAYIPGEGHNLQQHSTVLVVPGNIKDLPGVQHYLIRGKYDLSEVKGRKQGRSKYGAKRPKQ